MEGSLESTHGFFLESTGWFPLFYVVCNQHTACASYSVWMCPVPSCQREKKTWCIFSKIFTVAVAVMRHAKSKNTIAQQMGPWSRIMQTLVFLSTAASLYWLFCPSYLACDPFAPFSGASFPSFVQDTCIWMPSGMKQKNIGVKGSKKISSDIF